jgi:hypothetical protein
MQLTLADLKARIARLDKLARGLAKEVRLQRGAEDVLLFRERRQYLRAIQEALAGADAARVVLEGVVKRMGGPVSREVPSAMRGAPGDIRGDIRVRRFVRHPR